MAKPLSSAQPLWRWLAGTLVIAMLVVLFIRQRTEEEREVRSMPAAERRALYQRTFETLQNTCATSAGARLNEFCRNQAEFISLFSECDRDCRAFVLQLTSSPTR